MCGGGGPAEPRKVQDGTPWVLFLALRDQRCPSDEAQWGAAGQRTSVAMTACSLHE